MVLDNPYTCDFNRGIITAAEHGKMKIGTVPNPCYHASIGGFLIAAFAIFSTFVLLISGCTPESFDHQTISVDEAGRAVSAAVGTQTVVVYLFRTTCPHCRKSFQQVLDVAERYPDVLFLAYSTDRSDRRLDSYLNDYDLPFSIQRLKRWKSGEMTKAMNKAGLRFGKTYGVPLFAVFSPKGERMYQGSSIHNAEIRLKRLKSYG